MPSDREAEMTVRSHFTTVLMNGSGRLVLIVKILPKFQIQAKAVTGANELKVPNFVLNDKVPVF